jgi:hypothetical protein
MFRILLVVLGGVLIAKPAMAQTAGAQPVTTPTNGGTIHPGGTAHGPSPRTPSDKPVSASEGGQGSAKQPVESSNGADGGGTDGNGSNARNGAGANGGAPAVPECSKPITDKSLLDRAAAEAKQEARTSDYYLISIGPDGLPTNPIPSHLGEDKPLVVVLYHPAIIPSGKRYDLTVTGCQPVPVRVLGSLAEAGKVFSRGNETPLTYEVRAVGRCSSDSAVTITVSVPVQPGFCPNPAPTPITIKTDPIYSFTVGLGAVASFGSFKNVGVDPGVGGAPGVVFERTHNVNYDFAGVVMFYPGGLDPVQPFEIGRRWCVGTAVPLTSPISTANLLLGLALVPGLQVAAGMQFLQKEQVLDSGLKNGSVFNDDSSTLPTHQEWRFNPAFVASISLGTQLLSDVKGH